MRAINLSTVSIYNETGIPYIYAMQAVSMDGHHTCGATAVQLVSRSCVGKWLSYSAMSIPAEVVFNESGESLRVKPCVYPLFCPTTDTIKNSNRSSVCESRVLSMFVELLRMRDWYGRCDQVQFRCTGDVRCAFRSFRTMMRGMATRGHHIRDGRDALWMMKEYCFRLVSVTSKIPNKILCSYALCSFVLFEHWNSTKTIPSTREYKSGCMQSGKIKWNDMKCLFIWSTAWGTHVKWYVICFTWVS